eukprot:scaffold57937_cov60-Phaeocystis_antarctica.AAC.5
MEVTLVGASWDVVAGDQDGQFWTPLILSSLNAHRLGECLVTKLDTRVGDTGQRAIPHSSRWCMQGLSLGGAWCESLRVFSQPLAALAAQKNTRTPARDEPV